MLAVFSISRFYIGCVEFGFRITMALVDKWQYSHHVPCHENLLTRLGGWPNNSFFRKLVPEVLTLSSSNGSCCITENNRRSLSINIHSGNRQLTHPKPALQRLDRHGNLHGAPPPKLVHLQPRRHLPMPVVSMAFHNTCSAVAAQQVTLCRLTLQHTPPPVE